MKKLSSREIRSTFIDYFKKQGHTHEKSSPLVPENDATLLFTNSGMVQFKNCFLGQEDRGYTRAVTSQKSVRAGGKHNDLDNVGFTARHHTFFEMLGNFSFGDYFKKDAIHFAWELLTKEVGIPKERLYVTVFQDDDEAADIWHKQEGVPTERIYRFGEKDNFWRMGDVGPCGPCSEIFYDHGPAADPDPSKPSKMGDDGDRFVEIWNLVFMQFFEDGKGGRSKLPKPSVDTGAGLERWAAALNGKLANYDSDLFQPIIRKAQDISKAPYEMDIRILAKDAKLRESTAALRVVADHSRATAFLIADGVMPSNEGRGYVLRRIMRRAIRYARKLSDDPSMLKQTVAVVIQEMSEIYPELKRAQNLILSSVQDEVVRFGATLDQGTLILEDAMKKMTSRGQKVLDGETAFRLYDTYGFPIDLTRLMTLERGYTIDEPGFEKQMEGARERAKSASKFKAIPSDQAHLTQLASDIKTKSGATRFTGYSNLNETTKILAISDGKKVVTELKPDQSGIVILETTPFYAESGGQIGDNGRIDGGGAESEVNDCTKLNDIYFHHVHVKQGTLKVGAQVIAEVVDPVRQATANNHSATHLMHAALRSVLGGHVTQAGSLVTSERTRFDFTHNKPLTEFEIDQIEKLVNNEIALGVSVEVAEMPHKEAIAKGALALFGEKYGDKVRVIRMGDFSCELCGGTHVTNTGAIRVFKIISETGVSAGVRRIEAITGQGAVQWLMRAAKESQAVKQAVGGQSALEWIDQAKNQIRDLEKQLKAAKGASVDVEAYIKSAKALAGGAKLVTAAVDMDDRQVLAELSDKIRDKIGSGVVVIVGRGDATHPVIVSVSKDLTAKYDAGKLLGDVAKVMGGKGGGRPEFAQGMAPDRSRLAEAFATAEKLVGPS